MNTKHLNVCIVVLSLLVIAMGTPRTAQAHCDSMDGPVVKAARTALSEGNVNLVLIWVQRGDDDVNFAFAESWQLSEC